MSKKTKEKIKKHSQKGVISSEEEYIEAKKRLEFYIKEYNWLNESKDPIRETIEEARKIVPMITTEKSISQRHFRTYYNFLINRKKFIEDGSYGSILMQNIISLYIQTKQYEIDSKDYSLIDILKGFLGKNKDSLEAYKFDRLFSKFRIWDGIPVERDISIQSVRSFLERLDKEVVALNLLEPDESVSLTISDGYLSRPQKDVIDFVNILIASSKGNELDKSDRSTGSVNKGSKTCIEPESKKNDPKKSKAISKDSKLEI